MIVEERGEEERRKRKTGIGGFPRRGFGSCRSNQSRIVGHMARERAACVGVACQAFLRAARKLVTSSSACVSGQSRPDYLTPGRAYVATPSPSPNRLLLSQLTPGQIKPSITIAYKNPFYSPAFLPFLARQVVPAFSTRVSQRVLFLSFLFPTKSYKPKGRRKVWKDWTIRDESVSGERKRERGRGEGKSGVLRGMCVRVCCRAKQPGGLTLRLKKSASGKLLLPLFCSRLLLPLPPSQDVAILNKDSVQFPPARI